MAIDLSGCRAKIERAQYHRDGLKAVVTPLIEGHVPETELIQLSAKLDTQSGYHVFRVATIPEAWRPGIGVALGDVVHNLRSALEYLFFELCCHYLGTAKTERLGNQVQFPLEDRSQGLTNKWVHFGKIPSSQWAVIKAAQPYNAPDPRSVALKALRDLSNRDKHRVLNPLLMRSDTIQFYDSVQAVRATTDFDWPDEGPHALGSQYLEVGTHIVSVGLPEEVDPEVEVAGHITPNIRLPEATGDAPEEWPLPVHWHRRVPRRRRAGHHKASRRLALVSRTLSGGPLLDSLAKCGAVVFSQSY